MRISDWSSDVCSSDLTLDGDPLDGGFLAALDAQWRAAGPLPAHRDVPFQGGWALYLGYELAAEIEPILRLPAAPERGPIAVALRCPAALLRHRGSGEVLAVAEPGRDQLLHRIVADVQALAADRKEHTSELQSLMRNSYAV